MHNYSVSAWVSGRSVTVTSAQILNAFKETGAAVPESLAEITAKGIRYSNEDFDVLSGAMISLRKQTGLGYEWVAGMAQ